MTPDPLELWLTHTEQRDRAIAAEGEIRAHARETYHDRGEIVIYDDAIVTESEGGYYVAAWVFVRVPATQEVAA